MKETVLIGAVFDCNVFLQAVDQEKSVAAECLRFVEKGSVRLYFSKNVLVEVEDVLSRPEIRNHFQILTNEIVEAFVLKLRETSHNQLRSKRIQLLARS